MRVHLYGRWMRNVIDAFAERGHQVMTFDPDTTDLPRLIQHLHDLGPKDIVGIGRPPDLLIAFPPCQYLCSSGLHWNTKFPERADKTRQALEVVRLLLSYPAPRICLENPVGCISSQIRKPDQMIQPYHFGHDASKKTCLWLKNLPLLEPTTYVAPRHVNGKPRWSNQFDSGQNNQVNATNRTEARAERWRGVCDAMASQWGAL